MVTGIDFSGVVAEVNIQLVPTRRSGVVLTGWGVGEEHWAGLRSLRA